MTGSLRLSALLLLLLSRWASADLEKGEDEFVRSWVIIEEQLVPPSRDDLLAAGGGGTAVVGGTGAGVGRRITPKSVFVAPSFNKCSDGYRPDSMGRCVKVVKLDQAAQWDFLLKQLNSMYGSGGGFPMPAASPFQPVPMTTTTTEPSLQKTDSPGPFQLNIPLAGEGMDMFNQTMESVDELTTSTATGTTVGTTVADDATVTTNAGVTINTTTDDEDAVDHTSATVTATAVTTETASDTRSRPNLNRYQQEAYAEDVTTTAAPSYESQLYSTTFSTDAKVKYVENSKPTSEDSSKTAAEVANGSPPSPSSPTVITTTAVGDAETEEPVTVTTAEAATTNTEAEGDDVVTVLAVAAMMDGVVGSNPPPTTMRIPQYTTNSRRPQPLSADTVMPEYYDDQTEDSTLAPPEPDCSAPNAYRYYATCADLRQQQLQQQQFQQIQQQQILLQQHQQQQHLYQQQQQQQFYQQQQQQQQQQHHHQRPHVATPLVKRPVVGGGGVQVRFPEEDYPASATSVDNVNLIRFPGSAPYRTTNKMYESSRHPTWWPTGWPEPQQQPGGDIVQQQQQQQQQQHRLQHHLPQQKQDVRLWEFGSRLPKSTTSTTAIPPPLPPPTQWFRGFF